MKFLVDAQLPKRLMTWLIQAGCDAIHTLDLPDANRSTDDQVTAVAAAEERIVITKDADFVDRHLLQSNPEKLFLISTGNMTNQQLESIFVPIIPEVISEFQSNRFVELTNVGLVTRG